MQHGGEAGETKKKKRRNCDEVDVRFEDIESRLVKIANFYNNNNKLTKEDQHYHI